MLAIIMSILCLNVVNMLLINNLEVCDSMMEVSIKEHTWVFVENCYTQKNCTWEKLFHAKKKWLADPRSRC
jgi:hypothetical protein